jgi:hypothetical protein
MPKTPFTLGHSIHPIGTFFTILNAFQTNTIVDVRHHPSAVEITDPAHLT